MKPEIFKFKIKINGSQSLKRATKAIKIMGKSLDRLNKSTIAATESFNKMKATLPAFVEIEMENDNG